MSYTNTTWQNGDIITAQKLNNIQNGIKTNENDFFIVQTTYDYDNDSTGFNKTFEEMLNAHNLGKKILLLDGSKVFLLIPGNEGPGQPISVFSYSDFTIYSMAPNTLSAVKYDRKINNENVVTSNVTTYTWDITDMNFETV